jgi:hypothetical protein
MKSLKYYISGLLLVSIYACNSEKKTESNTMPLPAAGNAGLTLPSTADTSSTGETLVLNPAHGQPGHRCDIAVGAPLNGTATNNTPVVNATNATPSQSITNPGITSSPVTTLPATNAPANGLNPQHGQPGHRCDIAVGAPLNSKPGN